MNVFTMAELVFVRKTIDVLTVAEWVFVRKNIYEVFVYLALLFFQGDCAVQIHVPTVS